MIQDLLHFVCKFVEGVHAPCVVHETEALKHFSEILLFTVAEATHFEYWNYLGLYDLKTILLLQYNTYLESKVIKLHEWLSAYLGTTQITTLITSPKVCVGLQKTKA